MATSGNNCDPCDVICQGLAMTVHGMNQAYANINGVRMDGAVHYAENVRYAHLAGVNNMTQTSALGYRTAAESGSGIERRYPDTGGGVGT